MLRPFLQPLYKFCVLTLSIGFLLSISSTESRAASVGSTGASFLDIPVGAGPAAMGGAYSALATNAYGPSWNPGAMAWVDVPQAAAQHLSYIESVNYEYASFAYPLGRPGALGVSAQYLTSGDIAGTDPSGTPTGSYSSHYGAYTAAYGVKLVDKWSLGLAGKWINAKINEFSADAYAMDIGTLYKVMPHLNLAATATNIGSTLKFIDQPDSLPLMFHVGAAYQPASAWLLSMEGVDGREGLAGFRVGGQWQPLDMIAIRAGYRTDVNKELSALAGFSTGIGLELWGQEFSYAWVPYGDLGSTQYFSLLLKFGQPEGEKRNLIQYRTIKEHKSARAITPDNPEDRQMMELLSDKRDPLVSAQGATAR